MTKEERLRLETLDTALRSDNVREHIRSVVARLREQLARKKDAPMSWQPFPLDVLATTLPPEIRSAWVFVFFHTVPAEELIEERPDDSCEAGTRQKKYLGK